ncbi:hypothetical protein ABZX65_07790 [Streptomyces sp. NPDC003300]|uniref:hypothetical protein n=1 Tax=unclassified Streptomyces TaxID=2593676 RepID=UPI0033BC15CB
MYATPRKKDPQYDHSRQHATIPLTLHQHDGTELEIELVLSPDEMELHWALLERLIDRRDAENRAADLAAA